MLYKPQWFLSRLLVVFAISRNLSVGYHDLFIGPFHHFSPSLTWRDVQYLIVYTANPDLTNDTDNLTRNGAGLAVSRQYGFGVMDAEAMVTRARHWINVPPQREDIVNTVSQ